MRREQLIEQLFEHALLYPKEERFTVIASTASGEGFDGEEIANEVIQLIEATSTEAASRTWSYFSEFQPGDRLDGRFRIIRRIGAGGMGIVYEAEDELLKRRIALKTIRPEWTDDEGMQKRFLREIQVVKDLNHSNVCRVAEAGTYQQGGRKHLFFTMELMQGKTLEEESKARCFSRKEALPLLRQVAAAIDHVHGREVIHRDLKPGNIFLEPEPDGSRRAVVMDFGIAHQGGPGATQLTRTGEHAGTSGYSAPEQLTGKAVGKEADIFALGLISHYMVTGKLSRRLSASIQDVVLRPKAALWAWAAGRCLADDPKERWHSAEAFTRALSWPVWPIHALLILCLAGGLWAARMWQSGPAGPAKTIAVMPFTGPSGEVTAGTTDTLARHLSLSRELIVEYGLAVGRNRAQQPPAEIARYYGVSLVLRGSAQVEDGKYTIRMILTDASGGQVWSKTYTASREQLLALEQPIYRDLAIALQIPRQAQPPTVYSPEAYFDLAQGKAALRESHPDEAIKFFTSALKKDPRMAAAHAAIADALMAKYRDTNDSMYMTLAAQAAQQARALGGTAPEVYRSLGTLYQTLGRYDEASIEIRKAIALEPASDESYRRLGKVYLMAEKRDECIQAYLKAIDIRANYWNNQRQLGLAYFHFGENDKALEAFQRTAELEPHYSYGLADEGAVYLRLGRYSEAASTFRKALDIEKDPDTYSNLGMAYFYTGDYPKAAGAFEEAANMKPRDHALRGNLADAYFAQKRRKQAAAAYQEAISLAYRALDVNPNDASAHAGLARYYAKTGNLTRAQEEATRAYQLAPANADVLYSGALVDARAKRYAEAVSKIWRVLEHGYTAEQVRLEPEFAPLRSEKAFQELVSKR